MTPPQLADLVQTALLSAVPGRLALLGCGAALFYAWARASAASERVRRSGDLAVVALALACSAVFVVQQASVVDDAFISFRYADHLLRGDGLVFNPGERVEGMTNLLWTLLVAAGAWLTGAEPPAVALVGDAIAFAGCVAATAWVSRWLGGRRGVVGFPLAACLIAVQYRMTASATTGLETAPVALAVVLGAIGLASNAPLGRAGAGLVLLAATLMHPDAALAFVAGGIAAWAGAAPGDRWRAIAAFGAGLPLFAAATAVHVAYYGDLVPNTAYAKSADLPYYAQGVAYTASFLLGSWLWIAVPIAVYGLARAVRDRQWTVLHVFFGLFVAAKCAYVIRLGGDFMDGRLFVDVIAPLLLLAEDGAARAPARAAPWLFAALFATLRGTCLIPANAIVGFLSDENTLYPLIAVDPITVDHRSSASGRFLHRVLVDRGIKPVIAAGGIGQVAYYSDLELIDLHGLTDAIVAHGPAPKRRGYPGHEKHASRAYLIQRGVRFVQAPSLCTGPSAEVARLRFEGLWSRDWCIIVYDRVLMHEIATRVPEIGFVDFEGWLDRYIAGLPGRDRATVAADWAWIRPYYFDANDDPAREAAFTAYLAGHH